MRSRRTPARQTAITVDRLFRRRKGLAHGAVRRGKQPGGGRAGTAATRVDLPARSIRHDRRSRKLQRNGLQCLGRQGPGLAPAGRRGAYGDELPNRRLKLSQLCAVDISLARPTRVQQRRAPGPLSGNRKSLDAFVAGGWNDNFAIPHDDDLERRAWRLRGGPPQAAETGEKEECYSTHGRALCLESPLRICYHRLYFAKGASWISLTS